MYSLIIKSLIFVFHRSRLHQRSKHCQHHLRFDFNQVFRQGVGCHYLSGHTQGVFSVFKFLLIKNKSILQFVKDVISCSSPTPPPPSFFSPSENIVRRGGNILPSTTFVLKLVMIFPASLSKYSCVKAVIPDCQNVDNGHLT